VKQKLLSSSILQIWLQLTIELYNNIVIMSTDWAY